MDLSSAFNTIQLHVLANLLIDFNLDVRFSSHLVSEGERNWLCQNDAPLPLALLRVVS